ncbi:actin-histidine N-methyltransferase-like [Anopheles nili]|uniref:actin-histidine N-methyltransferase-like n=1 Tax=Anopheles nili TaxID=185578 RepID=UPI00237AF1D8|nr:actin-histidine N-methyltransferase-like [Anopheles nili]
MTTDGGIWAVSTVMTRQNKVPVNLAELDGMDYTLALIPFWDMANHAYPGLSPTKARHVAETCYNPEREQLECSLPHPVDTQSSEPIFIYYGTRTDAEFLVHNGFVYPQNPYTSVQKRFALTPAIPLFKERSHLLDLLGMPTSGVFSFGLADKSRLPVPIAPELMTLARVSTMTDRELEQYTTMEPMLRQELIACEPLQVSPLNERADRWLATVMKIMLRRYATTIEDDEALLKANRQMHHIRRLLIEYRIAEKLTLHSWVARLCPTVPVKAE